MQSISEYKASAKRTQSLNPLYILQINFDRNNSISRVIWVNFINIHVYTILQYMLRKIL